MTSLFDHLQNPREQAVKKYFQEILKERCLGNKDIIEKISHYIITDRDLKELGSLVADLYESGYMKALDDYKDQLKELGLEVKIKAEENTSY